MAESKDLSAALRAGRRRAAGHVARAGKELLAGIGGFLDEVIRAKRDSPRGDEEGRARPTHIDVD